MTTVAQRAMLARAGQPRHADTVAEAVLRTGWTELDDSADDLVARDARQGRRRQLAIDDVQVGAADPAGLDAQADLPCAQRPASAAQAATGCACGHRPAPWRGSEGAELGRWLSPGRMSVTRQGRVWPGRVLRDRQFSTMQPPPVCAASSGTPAPTVNQPAGRVASGRGYRRGTQNRRHRPSAQCGAVVLCAGSLIAQPPWARARASVQCTADVITPMSSDVPPGCSARSRKVGMLIATKRRPSRCGSRRWRSSASSDAGAYHRAGRRRRLQRAQHQFAGRGEEGWRRHRHARRPKACAASRQASVVGALRLAARQSRKGASQTAKQSLQ